MTTPVPVSGASTGWRWGSTWRSALVQRRVVGALLIREILTRYGRHNVGVLWMVLEPMLFTMGIAVLWYVAKFNAVVQLPVVAFAVTGYSSVLLWRNASNRCAKAIQPNLSLMYHRNVRVLDIFMARIALECAGATASLMVLTVAFTLMGLMSWPVDFLQACAAWLMLCWFATSLGLLVGAVSEMSEVFERVWHIITYFMFPVSGAVFMVHWLPSSLQEAALWVPMVHGVEALRAGFFGSAVPTYGSLAYLAMVNLLMMLLGLLWVRRISQSVRPE